jgi:hypothetical protein
MKKRTVSTVPYGHNDKISVYYELAFLNDVIKPGDTIKFKNVRGQFTFLKFVHNSELDVSWIDCMDGKTKEFRSFYIEKLKTVVRPKRSRRKKQLVK